MKKSWQYWKRGESPIVTIHNDSQETIQVVLETGMNIYETVRLPIVGERTARKIADSIKQVKVPSIFLEQTIPPGGECDFVPVGNIDSTHEMKVMKRFYSEKEGKEVTGVFISDQVMFTGFIYHITSDDLQTPLSIVTASGGAVETPKPNHGSLVSSLFNSLITFFNFFVNLIFSFLTSKNKKHVGKSE